jgi:hypothetical protein
MWRPRFAAVAVSLALTVFLTIPDGGLAQSVPGYRMRVPSGIPLGPAGASVRPPRLTGITPNTLDPRGEQFRRRSFIPYWPFVGYYLGPDGYEYPGDSTGETYSTETQRVPVQPTRDVYPVYDTVPALGPLQVSPAFLGSRSMVRLTWRDQGVGAAQVAFFLADTGRAVLSAQTVRSPPFTALFEPPPGTAFTGMTVVLPGGTLVTQFLPYRWRTR